MSKYTSEAAYVYVIEDESGIIKVGRSTNPPQRFNYVQRCCGLCIIRRHLSPLCYNHKQIETAMLIEFGNHLKQGEHVSKVSFETVCAALDKQPFQTELPSVPPQSLVPFQFQEHTIRVVLDEHGNPWFVAKDVCDALGIAVTQTRRLDEDEKGLRSMQTLGGEQQILFISEAGLYNLILSCRRFKGVRGERIKVFKRWVTHEVLPSIRQKGYYSLYGEVSPTAQTLVNEVAQATIEKITTTLAPLTQNPVVVVHTTHADQVKRLEVSFRIKLAFEVREI